MKAQPNPPQSGLRHAVTVASRLFGIVAAKLGGSVLLLSMAAVAAFAGENKKNDPMIFSTSLPREGSMPAFARTTEWINSEPLNAAELRGKVVLVDFWTYTCVNWLRTLPYIRAWAEKYKDQGLVVIAVHSPEFQFEKDAGNVRQAARDLHVNFPVAIDSDHAIWRAFHNQYWPALYLVDARGVIRYHKFGEGDYVRSEMAIKQLLTEARLAQADDTLVSIDARGAEVAADERNLLSPETYLGYERTQNFGSPGRLAAGKSRAYSLPGKLKLNYWALAGDWTVNKEAALLNANNGRLLYRFHARDANLVMGPASRGAPVRFRVLIDGQPPGNAHGSDVNADGYGTVNGQRLYQLIRQPAPIAERTVEIEFLDAGVEVFSFTFG